MGKTIAVSGYFDPIHIGHIEYFKEAKKYYLMAVELGNSNAMNILALLYKKELNITEAKKLTNHRASGSDDATRIAPKTLMTLEECMEYIQQDECIEVTPNFIRMRKVVLNEDERKKVQKRMEAEAS